MSRTKQNTAMVADKSGPTGFVLFVAWFGALVYFFEQAVGFGGFIVAFFKACVWPAYLLYELLTVLNV